MACSPVLDSTDHLLKVTTHLWEVQEVVRMAERSKAPDSRFVHLPMM